MKTVLIICYGPLNSDPRVQRQIGFLEGEFSVVCAGMTDPGVQGVKYIKLGERLTSILKKIVGVGLELIIGYQKVYWSGDRVSEFEALLALAPDLIIANDLDALPISVRLADHLPCKVLFDAHEYYPDFGQRKGLKNLLATWRIIHFCKKFLPRVDTMTTVSNGIRDRYYKEFNVKAVVIRNTAKLHDLQPSPVNGNRIELVHHGVALPGRKLEHMVNMMSYLDSRFRLNFYLVIGGYADYYHELIRMAADHSDRIYFHLPVPTNQIITEIHRYDIGLFLLPPTNFNYAHALPNKFFEFIQARLAVAIGPSPEMSSYVSRFDLGIVSDNFEPGTMAKQLNLLTAENVNRFKINSHENAHDLSSESDRNLFQGLVHDLVK